MDQLILDNNLAFVVVEVVEEEVDNEGPMSQGNKWVWMEEVVDSVDLMILDNNLVEEVVAVWRVDEEEEEEVGNVGLVIQSSS